MIEPATVSPAAVRSTPASGAIAASALSMRSSRSFASPQSITTVSPNSPISTFPGLGVAVDHLLVMRVCDRVGGRDHVGQQPPGARSGSSVRRSRCRVTVRTRASSRRTPVRSATRRPRGCSRSTGCCSFAVIRASRSKRARSSGVSSRSSLIATCRPRRRSYEYDPPHSTSRKLRADHVVGRVDPPERREVGRCGGRVRDRNGCHRQRRRRSSWPNRGITRSRPAALRGGDRRRKRAADRVIVACCHEDSLYVAKDRLAGDGRALWTRSIYAATRICRASRGGSCKQKQTRSDRATVSY